MGFSLELFPMEIDGNFICTICSEVFKDPVIMPCEHIFCRDCICRWLKDHNDCPIDRSTVKDTNPMNMKPPNRPFLNLLKGLNVKCSNHAKGCIEILKLEFLEKHSKQCKFAPISRNELGAGDEDGQTLKEVRLLKKNHQREVGELKKRVKDLEDQLKQGTSTMATLRLELADQKEYFKEMIESLRNKQDIVTEEIFEEMNYIKQQQVFMQQDFQEDKGSKLQPVRRSYVGEKTSMAALVDELLENKKITNGRVACIMKKVDRKNYCRDNPYVDNPQRDKSKGVIKSPSHDALVLEKLSSHLIPGARVLQCNSKGGYLTACLALLVTSAGKVLCLHQFKESLESSVANLTKQDRHLLESKTVEYFLWDRVVPHHGQLFDAIQVDLFTDGELESYLLQLLKVGGRMMNTFSRSKWLIYDKIPNGRIKRELILV